MLRFGLFWCTVWCAWCGAGCTRNQIELIDGAIDAPRHQPECQGRPCACSDGIDNDGDGLTDGRDDACTGALDDDEAILGLAPARGVTCLDCFFDSNEGTGDDGCQVAWTCRELGVSDPRSCGPCSVEADCLANCQPLVPNGCDCFGCCGVETAAGTRNVVLEEDCSLGVIDDPLRCRPCVPNPLCMNPCERCEICPGRPVPPSDCAPYCGDGQAVCGGQTDCPGPEVCVLGCCISQP